MKILFLPATTQKSTVPLSNQTPYKSNHNPKYIFQSTFLYKQNSTINKKEVKMEIILEIDHDVFSEEDTKEVDRLRRNIFQRFPEAVWERFGKGHKIII